MVQSALILSLLAHITDRKRRLLNYAPQGMHSRPSTQNHLNSFSHHRSSDCSLLHQLLRHILDPVLLWRQRAILDLRKHSKLERLFVTDRLLC